MEKQTFEMGKIYLAAQNWLLFFVILAGSLYITSIVMTSFFYEVENLTALSVELKEMSIKMFTFLRPFIELSIILWVSNFVLRKLGIHVSGNLSAIKWNAKKIVGVSLLFTFVVAALVLTQASVYLKGVVLFFVGIYIGSNIDAVRALFKLSKREEHHVNINND